MNNNENDDYVIVYSSDGSHLNKKKKDYTVIVESEITISIRLEKKGRGGKSVTVMYEYPENPKYFKKLVKELKRLCGVGGTLRPESIEIQGDQRDKVSQYLQEKGFKTKLTGG
jgi:translation initiation factor 1